MPRSLPLVACALILSLVATQASGGVIECYPWQVRPTGVSDGPKLEAYRPGNGWVSVRPRGVDGPRPDGSCSTERFLAVLAKTKTVLAMAEARLVAFCAPQDLADGEVEATVLFDGVDLQRILSETQLAQPLDGSAKVNWCER
ncbi:hypothetical protein FBZ81_104437 [Azospirillum brasilense]|nr:hypothetical protein AMK58_13610 [Azospirillum brasilense]TWB83521.1 hypothetical protein FBZ81_104437 [Azospirillum brasilense]